MTKTKNPNNLKKRYAVICAQIEADNQAYDKATDHDEKFNIDQGIYIKWVERVRLERLICASPGDAIFKLKVALANATIAGEENGPAWMMVKSALQDMDNLPVPPDPPLRHPAAAQAKQLEYREAA